MTAAAAELRALAAAIEGSVLLPGSDDYELGRRAAWAQYDDLQPAAIVRCAIPEDVGAAIAVGRLLRVEIVPRSGGHCFAGRSSTRGIVVDVGPMDSVAVSEGVASIGAGARLGWVYDELDRLGLTIAAGTCPTVGIAGLALGGGLGILGRRFGLTSDQLVGARVVLADGRVVDCDEGSEADLFWALRGGGGGRIGVVTSLGLTTVPADRLTCFKLTWPLSDAVAAVDAWQAWAPDAADELAASLLVTAGGALAEPEVTLFGSMLASEPETGRTLDGFVSRLDRAPLAAVLVHLQHRAAKRFLAEQAPAAAHAAPSEADAARPLFLAKSSFFRRELPRDAIAALVDGVAAAPAGELRELDFTPWGGAYNRVRSESTAFAHRQERFLLLQTAALDAAASAPARLAAQVWLRDSWAAVQRWSSGGVFPNFRDRDLPDPRVYDGENSERLLRVEVRYDPDGVFQRA